MELKQKVIRIQITVFCMIILAAVGYLSYFIFSDTLKAPPPNSKMGNLFIAKQRKDIQSLEKTTNINACKILYENILLSLKEDKINSFIDNEQYNSLNKELHFAYTEQFIALADKYFEQSEWKSNNFVSKIITEIKRNGFVEQNTPIWNSLTGFENNIACYNEMQKCIIEIYAITNNLRNYIPLDKIFDKKNEKQSLLKRNCMKNKGIENELISSYKKLEEQAKSNAKLTITTTTDFDFDASGGSKTITINTNVPSSSWNFSGVYRWLSISKSGSSLTVKCEANPDVTERTDKFNIKVSFDKFETAWEKDFVTINIKQEGKVQNITGNIEKIWVDHNVSQSGQYGMKIHAKFSVGRMLNKQGKCVAWFYYSDGTKLKDQNGKYKTSDGQVSTSEDFKPSFDNSTYNDFIIFMPYGELHLAKGKHNLKFDIGIFDHNSKQIAISEYVYFDANQP